MTIKTVREISRLRTTTIDPVIKVLEQKKINRVNRLERQKSGPPPLERQTSGDNQTATIKQDQPDVEKADIKVDPRVEILAVLDAKITIVNNKELSLEVKLEAAKESMSLIQSLKNHTKERTEKGDFTLTKDPLESKCSYYSKIDPRIATATESFSESINKKIAASAVAVESAEAQHVTPTASFKP